MELGIQLGVAAVLLLLGFVFGRLAERRHYRSIHERERRWLAVPWTTEEGAAELAGAAGAGLAFGSVVVSVDAYKRLLARLVGLFGGEITAYSSLLDRARREAVLRMKESSPHALAFVNVRIETSQIGGIDQRATATVEAFAYATALLPGA